MNPPLQQRWGRPPRRQRGSSNPSRSAEEQKAQRHKTEEDKSFPPQQRRDRWRKQGGASPLKLNLGQIVLYRTNRLPLCIQITAAESRVQSAAGGASKQRRDRWAGTTLISAASLTLLFHLGYRCMLGDGFSSGTTLML